MCARATHELSTFLKFTWYASVFKTFLQVFAPAVILIVSKTINLVNFAQGKCHFLLWIYPSCMYTSKQHWKCWYLVTYEVHTLAMLKRRHCSKPWIIILYVSFSRTQFHEAAKKMKCNFFCSKSLNDMTFSISKHRSLHKHEPLSDCITSIRFMELTWGLRCSAWPFVCGEKYFIKRTVVKNVHDSRNCVVFQTAASSDADTDCRLQHTNMKLKTRLQKEPKHILFTLISLSHLHIHACQVCLHAKVSLADPLRKVWKLA